MPKGYNDEYLTTKVSLSAPLLFGPIGSTPFLYDVIDVAAPQNPLAYNPATGIYTCPLDGYYEVSISWTFPAVAVPPLPPPPYLFFSQIQLNGANLSPLAFTGWGGTTTPYPGSTPLRLSVIIFCNTGDTISTTAAYAPGSTTINAATMEIKGEAIFQPLMDIDFKYFLQDWKAKDLIAAVTDMFNLTFETDDASKVVIIEPKDSYVNTENIAALSEVKQGFYDGTTKDYSKLIDYKKKGSFEFPTMEGRFDYKYKSDSDETIEWIEDINPILIYESRFPIENGDDSRTKSKEVPFFAKSIHVSDVETRYPDTQTVPQFPLIYPQNYVLDPTAIEANKDVSPRIFYHAGTRFLSNPEIDGVYELFEIPGVASAVPMTFMVNYNDRTGLDPNLGFNSQIINGTKSVGLMEKFYLQELARNNIGEIRKNYVRFNSIDNLNFSFTVKGIIDGQRYVVQELEGYNPLKDAPTQFRFYLDVYPDSTDVSNIINSPLLGVATLESI
jgi:hypothetical protein